MQSDSNIHVRLFETGPAPSSERAEPVTGCPRRPSSPSLGSAYSPPALDAALENRSLLEPFSGRTALLSPFDRLIHDRKRTVELFDFDYQLEMYKPVGQRRWGYFALPG